jgi:hypothetical protein
VNERSANRCQRQNGFTPARDGTRPSTATAQHRAGSGRTIAEGSLVSSLVQLASVHSVSCWLR